MSASLADDASAARCCMLGIGLDAIGVPALHPHVTKVGAREVHDGAAQVRAERVGVDIPEPARDAHEGLLREVLGELALAR